jgi:hypothetical protein
MNQTDADKKLKRALELYAERHGWGALLDNLVRPLFPDKLRVVRAVKKKHRV